MPSKIQLILAATTAINAPLVAGAPVKADLERESIVDKRGAYKPTSSNTMADEPTLPTVDKRQTTPPPAILTELPSMGGAKRDIYTQGNPSWPSSPGLYAIDARQAPSPSTPALSPPGDLGGEWLKERSSVNIDTRQDPDPLPGDSYAGGIGGGWLKERSSVNIDARQDPDPLPGDSYAGGIGGGWLKERSGVNIDARQDPDPLPGDSYAGGIGGGWLKERSMKVDP